MCNPPIEKMLRYFIGHGFSGLSRGVCCGKVFFAGSEIFVNAKFRD